ncbi:MAG: hypothetical protein JSV42_15695 [Chloroflexota bacterium]|nr:MAG: hypothetical protein JSV42_15695 [Chloroflexota bacterium]
MPAAGRTVTSRWARRFFPPDYVNGWRGIIKGLTYDEPGAPQHDDAFILVVEYPIPDGEDIIEIQPAQ